jgi:hypothetical protein
MYRWNIGTCRPSARASAEARVIDIHEALDDFGSGGIIELRLDHIPFPAKVFLERKDVLGASPWSSEPVGIIAVSPSLLYAATMDESKMQEFFRFRVQPLDIVVSEDVDGFHIDLGADTPIEDVFAVFAMQGITIPSVPATLRSRGCAGSSSARVCEPGRWKARRPILGPLP